MSRVMLITLFLLGGTLFSPALHAEPSDLPGFTDFEFNGVPFGALLEEFSISADSVTATFTSTGDGDRVGAGFFGVGPAYRSGRYSWMVLEGTGRIEFSEPVSLVEFYATDLGAQGTIQAFSSTGASLLAEPLPISDGGFSGNPMEFIRLSMDNLAEAISAIELSSTAMIGNEMSIIDDFGFMPFVPAFSYQNPTDPFDVDGSGFVNALDLILVVRDINTLGFRELPAPTSRPNFFIDINGDSIMSPLDILFVVRELNRIAEGESNLAAVPEPATFTMALIAIGVGVIAGRYKSYPFLNYEKQ